VSAVDRFERKLEGFVGNSFARVFGGKVVPQEVAHTLQRESDTNTRELAGGHLLAPNLYRVVLGPKDHERLAGDDEAEDQVSQLLAETVAQYIAENGWETYGDVVVTLQRSEALHTGQFRTSSFVDPDAKESDRRGAPSRNAGDRPMSQQPPGRYTEGDQYGQQGPYGGQYDQGYSYGQYGQYGQPAYGPPPGYEQGYGQPGPPPGYDQGYGQPGQYGAYGQPGQYGPPPGYEQGYGQPGQYGHPPGYDQGYGQPGQYGPPPGYEQGYGQPGQYGPPPGYGQGYVQPGGQPGGYAPPAPPPPEPRERAAALQLTDGTNRQHALKAGSNVVGRGQDADFRLPDTGVSRRHLEISWDGQNATLADLGSTNGTTVNDTPVTQWQLQDGDVIRVGHSSMVFHVQG
jgi:hypothetical protein